MKDHKETFNEGMVVELMLKHAMWLAEEAKRYVDAKSWKEFAKTKILNVDEDTEMDEPEHERLVPCIPGPPGAPALSPRSKRVRSRTLPQMHHLFSISILTVAEC